MQTNNRDGVGHKSSRVAFVKVLVTNVGSVTNVVASNVNVGDHEKRVKGFNCLYYN